MNWHELLAWYDTEKRDLPWRQTTDPYKIWLSEVILQQTRVDQGLPYYYRFINEYADVVKMSKANEEAILKIWQGLGYYNRAINMHKTSKIIASEHDGLFPNSYDKLIQLKGIGPYTAAAIASFAFNEPKAVLDGNVFRVLSRLYDIDIPINTTVGKKTFSELADSVLDRTAPAKFNQAIMELGALVCKPKQPRCDDCPISSYCLALKNKTQHNLPVKLPKAKVKLRFLNFVIPIQDGKTFITKRDMNSIWKNLYEPFNFETESPLLVPDFIEHIKDFVTLGSQAPELAYETIHILSHQRINARFWVIKGAKKMNLPNEAVEVAISDIYRFPVHRLFDKFLNSYNLQPLFVATHVD